MLFTYKLFTYMLFIHIYTFIVCYSCKPCYRRSSHKLSSKFEALFCSIRISLGLKFLAPTS